MKTRKKEFLDSYYSILNNNSIPSVIVTIVRLPTLAKEIITNTTDIASKIAYIDNAYNDELELKNNTSIKILGWVIV